MGAQLFGQGRLLSPRPGREGAQVMALSRRTLPPHDAPQRQASQKPGEHRGPTMRGTEVSRPGAERDRGKGQYSRTQGLCSSVQYPAFAAICVLHRHIKCAMPSICPFATCFSPSFSRTCSELSIFTNIHFFSFFLGKY